MGIDVSTTKVVTHSFKHEERVATRSAGNPSYEDLGDLQVACVFKRKRYPRDDQDGNPLIYALKKLHGYTIDTVNDLAIETCACNILPDCFRGLKFDFVVPMPSSSRIVDRLASCAAKMLGRSTQIVSVFRKSTAAEVLASMPMIGSVPARDHEDYKATQGRLQTAKPHSAFSMKNVKHRIRQHVIPLIAMPNTKSLKGASILLVDDLVSSGQTLKVAHDILNGLGASTIRGLVLLGSVTR